MSHDVRLPPAWKKLLADEFEKPYFVALRQKVRSAYLAGPVFPHPTRIFRAFESMDPDAVRVVILGQDPYHTPGVADGLAFSSFPENPVPPSLLNMYKEIEGEYGCTVPRTPDLSLWSRQGVLLLNASLSVEQGIANSHSGFGWHEFTDAVIARLSEQEEHIVFLLWGNFAREKRELIDATKHCVLESAHPSPLSASKGFFGNNHFKKANEYLVAEGREPIDWCGSGKEKAAP